MRKHFTIKNAVAAAVLLMALAGLHSAAEAAEARVNLVFDNGTVLIYAGKEAGYKPGQALNVVRGGRTIGTLEVINVTSNYAQAKIITGQGEIVENDLVTVTQAGGDVPQFQTGPQAGVKKIDTSESLAATRSSSGSAEKADAEEGSSSTKSSSSRSSSKATSSRSSGRSSTSSRSSSRSGSSASSDSAETAEPADSGSSRSSRSRRGGSSDESSGADDSSASEKEQIEPAVLGKEAYYSLHLGYFFLSENLPGTNHSLDPAPMFSVDYWKPKKKNMNVYYSAMYTRPDMNTYFASQNVRYQLRIVQVSVGLIWDGLDDFLGYDTYAGVSAGWRNATSLIHCDVTCDGVMDTIKKSQEGIDYHGIFGVKVNKKSEVKLLYSFDEEYYTLDLGFRY